MERAQLSRFVTDMATALRYLALFAGVIGVALGIRFGLPAERPALTRLAGPADAARSAAMPRYLPAAAPSPVRR